MTCHLTTVADRSKETIGVKPLCILLAESCMVFSGCNVSHCTFNFYCLKELLTVCYSYTYNNICMAIHTHRIPYSNC